jgi:hypothetical protein
MSLDLPKACRIRTKAAGSRWQRWPARLQRKALDA